ncbi:MAG: S8 family serine peptidase [Deltaproteobacteria bacterium]|nr:S8 family serine peptidase [Deltaproteobacteria bacterium]
MAAPGVDVLSTIPGSSYEMKSGTSMATPHVCGIAALIRESHPEYSNDQVQQALRLGGTDFGAPGFDVYYGYGLVQADIALDIQDPYEVMITSPHNGIVLNTGDTLSVEGSVGSEDADAPTPYTLEWLDDAGAVISSLGGSAVIGERVLGELTVPTVTENRSYQLRLRTSDPDGIVFEDRIAYFVMNNPQVSLTAPAEDSTISGTVTFRGVALDDTGVRRISLCNPSHVCTVVTGVVDGAWDFDFDTRLFKNGATDLLIKVTDVYGNETIIHRHIIIDNPLHIISTKVHLLDDGQLRFEPNTNKENNISCKVVYTHSGSSLETEWFDGWFGVNLRTSPGMDDTATIAYEVMCRDSVTHERAATGRLTYPDPFDAQLIKLHGEGLDLSGQNTNPQITPDARYLAFVCTINDIKNICIHDLVEGRTQKITQGDDGSDANGASDNPSISDDGNFIAFESEATNLVPNDNNNKLDVFLYEKNAVGGTFTRISMRHDGAEPTGASNKPQVSFDGRYVVFVSEDPGLTRLDTNRTMKDLFRYDRVRNNISLVSKDASGVQGNGHSFDQRTSSDGNKVVFNSGSSIWTGTSRQGFTIFGLDVSSQTITQLSRSAIDGMNSAEPNVSGDGCSACAIESGYACNYNNPSQCTKGCGNGKKAGSEECDDGNQRNGDGCSKICRIEKKPGK